jgi:twinkle protein|tara:strand:- start:1569 stop:3272 length:1704 start_codon:yes stop_codon:yes gene_type:complete
MSFYEYGIQIKKSSGQVKVKCPKCSPDRKKKTDPCLSVNIDEGVWNCHNCGWKGTLKQKKEYTMSKKIYARPKNTKVVSSFSKGMLDWFNGRGISEKTLIDNKISEGQEYMPQIGKNINTIQFNYYKNEELVNVKYRDGNKNFKLVKDAERIMYGLDDIKEYSYVIIVEGEIDKLSFYEAGYTNCVSVPNGASNLKMEYLGDFPDDLEAVFLAVDMDEPGRKLEDELSRRIGRDICHRVSYPGECKDINEVLIQFGNDSVKECIENAQPYPLDGVLSVSSFDVDIDNLYEVGLNKGDTVGHTIFDNLFSFTKSQLTVITGIPTHGKSNFLEHLSMRLSAQKGWKFGVFSPEHYPLELHFSVLAEKFIGKSFRKITRFERMSKTELHQAKDFISEHYHWIRPDGDVYTIDAILESAKGLIKRYGINALIIDPYNKINADIGNGNETNYINKFLTKLTIFKQKYDIHIFLVAHPRKMSKKDNGRYEVPTLYDVAGSANFYNQVDNGITVYRDFHNELTDIHVQKIKFRHIGELGMVQFKYNLQNGRYSEIGESLDNECYLQGNIQESML